MEMKKQSVHGEWSSRFAFILAATGSAVGLGNIWKFPYITGENGGGAFVLVYLMCVLVIGIPIMIAESMLGRHTRQSPIGAMQQLTKEANADVHWHYLGWMGVIAGLLILSYYSVIAGWATAYVFKAFFGSFSGGDARDIKELFDTFTGSPLTLMFWHTLFMGATMWIVAQGIKDGLERAVRFLMPGLFVLLVVLVGYAMTTGAYAQGLHFLFKPDFSKITGNAVLIAMGHAFFTLSLGMGAIMVYGAYLPKNVSIAQTSILIAAADSIVALLAGLAIFPIVFANHLEPSSGPGLIFQTLPIAFGNMTGGWLIGILFFVMLVFAALTSAISVIEPAVAWLVETDRFDRKTACIWSGLTVWLLGLGTVFSFNVWADIKVFDKTFFQLLDYLTANLMLPIGGFCIAIFSGWIMLQKHSEAELAFSNPLYYRLWQNLVRYVAPVGIFLVFLHVVGVL
ncbi:MAG: sodium-dependent transporter [Methylococcaceae bacterium]|nr:sodium-dependent transporter [Methylococcaceae bacterium]